MTKQTMKWKVSARMNKEVSCLESWKNGKRFAIHTLYKNDKTYYMLCADGKEITQSYDRDSLKGIANNLNN